MNIRLAEVADCDAITRIYNHYIRETIITFEELEIDAKEMATRLLETRESSLPWLVCEDSDGVAGYAYATRWKGRCAYRFSVESTIYLTPGKTSQGIGAGLYGALLERLRERSMHAVIGGIALPNAASIALHERLGFRKVAHFKEVGFKFNRWIDVGYWQRSP